MNEDTAEKISLFKHGDNFDACSTTNTWRGLESVSPTKKETIRSNCDLVNGRIAR